MNSNVTNEYMRMDLLPASEVARTYPALTKQQLYRWAKTGKIPVVELPSGRKFFRREDIEALLRPVVKGSDGVLPGQLVIPGV